MARLSFVALAVVLLASLAPEAHAQALMTSLDTASWERIGWAGFGDYMFLLEALASLALAAVLGALIAFHPRVGHTIDTMEEAELPKTYIVYAIIGAMIGEVVFKYPVVAFVVFGIGGLMRFRTNTESTRDTGRLIIVTLLGLAAGLGLPHFAVVAAAFAWVMIYILEGQPLCELTVKELPEGRVGAAAEAYRDALSSAGCQIIGEKKAFEKCRVEFLFRCPTREHTQGGLRTEIVDKVPGELRGHADWKVQ